MILAVSPPPSANRIWVKKRFGGMTLSNEYRSWLHAAHWEIKLQKPEAMTGAVEVSLTVPENNRRDLDNFAKPTLDLLVKAGVIEGDRCKTVRKLHLGWHDQPAMTIEITSLSPSNSGNGSSKTSGRHRMATKSKPKDA